MKVAGKWEPWNPPFYSKQSSKQVTGILDPRVVLASMSTGVDIVESMLCQHVVCENVQWPSTWSAGHVDKAGITTLLQVPSMLQVINLGILGSPLGHLGTQSH